MKKFFSSIIGLALPAVMLAQGWPADYGGVMLQGFYWDSFKDTKWSVLEKQADELARSFDLIWIPQSAYCGGQSMGYDDLYWFTNYNSSFGTEAQLRSMIQTFKSKGLGTIADVVINHRKTMSNWVDFPAETYKGVTYKLLPTDICKGDDEGKTLEWAQKNGYELSVNGDTGEDWGGMRDLDHKSENVQKNVNAYLNMLLNDLGYTGFRYDMVKGYHPKYTGYYNAIAKPQFSVGECWDGTPTILNWIKGTAAGEGANNQIQSAAFDFQFRYTVRNACNGKDWSMLASYNENATNWPLISNSDVVENGIYRRYAVTFVENHDTEKRSTADQDPLRTDTLAANAYMLALPGTPCVFFKHWMAHKNDIAAMIAVRKAVGITNTSNYSAGRYDATYFTANTTGKNGRLFVILGNTNAYKPNDDNWKEVLDGYHYKYYMHRNMETAWVDRASGEYKEGFTAKLTAVSMTKDAQLVYTTDGTTPTAKSTKVESGTTLNIDKDMVLTVGMLIGDAVKGVVKREFTFEGGTPRPPFTPYTIKIHVKDPGWDNLNFWCWVEGSDNLCTENKQWPGDAILKDKILQSAGKRTEVMGDTFYYKEYTVKDYDYDIMFIFSNAGSPQTVNLGPFDKDVYLELAEDQPGGNLLVNDVTKKYTNAVNDLNRQQEVTSVKYVNIAGQVSSRPFDGVNLVVTRYSDGTQSTTKIIH